MKRAVPRAHSRRSVLAGLAAIAVAHATSAAERPAWPPSAWQSSRDRDHPLVGRIWAPQSRSFVDFGQVSALAADAHFLMIGEVHDNRDHHALQAVLTIGRRGRAVFEHLRADQSAALAAWRAQRTGRSQDDAERLLTALDWDKTGWPDRAMFMPLFAAVVTEGLDIVPGDLARDRMRDIARNGTGAVPPDEQARLALDHPLGPELASGLLDELEASHCGLIPRASFGSMAFAQRARDAALADAMLAGGREVPAVLFAGNGHVRADRGVAWYLARRAGDLRRVSILQLEVRAGLVDAEAYDQGTADYVLFTPGNVRDDPCVEMRKAFQKRN